MADVAAIHKGGLKVGVLPPNAPLSRSVAAPGRLARSAPRVGDARATVIASPQRRTPTMSLTTDKILAALEQHAPAIRRYGVRSLGLFGSHARGSAAVASDLDFVVEFETNSFDGYMDLKTFLEELSSGPASISS